MLFNTSQNKMRLFEVPLTQIRPKGVIREFLKRQRDGLSGHFKAMGYPYDTCLWEGRIPPYYQETEYNGKPLAVPESEQWWPYEQSAYLLDGLLRLGILLEDESMVELFRRNLDYLIGHAQPDGRLGGVAYGHHSEWPMAVLYKGVSAYLKAFPDKKVIDAFHRHFSAVGVEETADSFRNIATIEGMLDIARLANDDAVRQKAFDAYRRFDRNEAAQNPYVALTSSKMRDLKNIVFHGVTLCEEIKLPILLYLAGGDVSYLRTAEEAWRKVMEMHGQISGVPCSVEYGFGRDPQLGYETCVISDSLYSLGVFLMAEGNCAYADQMEKIAFNALPGAITKDFTALQYLSAPNQVVATGFSNNSSYLRGRAAFRQFRPDHFPSCCSGNVHRAMPNYVARLWMKDERGNPVAALYGASCFSFEINGAPCQIEEKTQYPFETEIRFVFNVERNVEFDFSFRIPEWCNNAEARIGGESVSLAGRCGSFVSLKRIWKDGDCLRLTLHQQPVQKRDRQWTWFECGPLVYSLPIDYTKINEKPNERFSPLRLLPTSSWAYAVAPNSVASLQRREIDGAYPFEKSPCVLAVEAHRAHGVFEELEQQRYTPAVPMSCSTDEARMLKLMPIGCTELRLTAFPDGVRRQLIPTLSAVVKEALPDEELPTMSPDDFISAASEIQADFSGYYDLARFFKKTGNYHAFIQIRFWSDFDGDATLALMASDSADGLFNGENHVVIPPLMEALASEPLWFNVKVNFGYNYIRLKVSDGLPAPQHRDAWGVQALLFAEEKQ